MSDDKQTIQSAVLVPLSWVVTTAAVVLVLAVAAAVEGVYLRHAGEHVEYVRAQCYLENRQAFIAEHRETQYVLRDETFCYEPRGGLLRPAKYVGRNRYEVKP